ncbi:hypothetical protein EJB05_11367, partial [Eragrostis curvula]
MGRGDAGDARRLGAARIDGETLRKCPEGRRRCSARSIGVERGQRRRRKHRRPLHRRIQWRRAALLLLLADGKGNERKERTGIKEWQADGERVPKSRYNGV